MANTKSAKKALRGSLKKKQDNLFWKKRIKDVVKNIKKYLEEKVVNADIIKTEESLLYKVVDKAAKNNVIHKNKANRIKSNVSKKVAAHATTNKNNEKPKARTTRAKPKLKS